MGEKRTTVANFALSKDFHELVRLQIHSLKGITTSLLFENIYLDKSLHGNQNPNASIDYTDVLIEYRLKEQLAEAEMIAEVHIESGIGKRLTIPVIVGLTGKMDKQECKLSIDKNNNITYIDDTFINFVPSKEIIDSNSNTSYSSIFSNSIASSSLPSFSSTSNIATISDESDWIELPIEYCQLPIESSIVITIWCYNVRTAEKILLSKGRMPMFDDKCSLNGGRLPIILDLHNRTRNLEDNITSKSKENLLPNKEHIIEKIQLNHSRPQWLNRLTLNKIDVNDFNKKVSSNLENYDIQLIVSFPNFEIPIVFSDIKYVPISLPSFDPSNSVLNYDPSFNQITYVNSKSGTIENDLSNLYSMDLLPFDPDHIRGEQMEDPIEQKFRRLERMQHLSPLDKELKPTLKMREALSNVMKKQFFEKMTAKERNMVWRYRWFMLNTLIVGNTPGWNNALINFIKCVDWNNNSEIKEFEMILRNLEDNINLKQNDLINMNKTYSFDIFIKKLQIIDCLELLSSNYKNSIVRNMAVKRLETATDSELSMFMVQLVQSIKNETLVEEEPHNERSKDNYDDSSRALSLSNAEIVHIDEEESELKPPSNKSADTSNYTLASSDFQIVENVNEEINIDSYIIDFIDNILFKNKKLKNINIPNIPSQFIDFLINRTIKNTSLTNYFYWALKVETEEEQQRNKQSSFRTIGNENLTMTKLKNENELKKDFNNRPDITPTITDNNNSTKYDRNETLNIAAHNYNDSNGYIYDNLIYRIIHELTMKKFIISLVDSQHGRAKLYELRRQIELVNKLHTFCYKIKIDHRKETTPKKIEILEQMLTENHKRSIFGSKYDSRNILLDDTRHENMVEFPKIAIPLDPSVLVNGTFPEESAVFKSSLNPLKITFKTINGEKYPIMYKIGDDLRQDQFVIQIISLMEKILESENMDLRLKPYKILATGEVEGFIQFIPNNSLSHILSNYNNSILLYLQTFNPDPTSHLGVNPQVMDNYVRSCAGYCVVTYILGVGDRHLENLLLSKDGHFFHADFGYILGQDPKPFPPLMKLPIQIIEGMGGSDNINYKKFCQYCFITYITLRKNASLILNLVQLMINTSIPALCTSIENSEAEKMELLWKVEEKFMLDMNDEEAVLHFQNLIDSSVNAVLPVVIDRLHNLAQYWRS